MKALADRAERDSKLSFTVLSALSRDCGKRLSRRRIPVLSERCAFYRAALRRRYPKRVTRTSAIATSCTGLGEPPLVVVTPMKLTVPGALR